LAEVMMAVAIFATVIVTTITTLQRAFSNLDSARNIETAGKILKCEMEKERLMTWAAVSDASYAPAIDPIFSGNPAVAGRFTLARSIATIPNRGGNTIRITLTVFWQNYEGRADSRSFSTYYSNGGLFTYFNSQT